jgi:hypothetical protein
VYEANKSLTVSESFLREVIDHRDDNIADPEKLDWRWLAN